MVYGEKIKLYVAFLTTPAENVLGNQDRDTYGMMWKKNKDDN